jgi:hypothetical protein
MLHQLMAKRQTHFFAVLAIAGYLTAVALPCPILTETASAAAGATTYSHTDHDHDAATAAVSSAELPLSPVPFLSKPCPCGCEGKSGGTLTAKRLGRSIPPEVESFAVAEQSAVLPAHTQSAPEIAPAPPELIPILS